MVADEAAEMLSSPEAVVEDFWEAVDPFRTGSAGVLVIFGIGAGGRLRLLKDGQVLRDRADNVLDPVIDMLALRLGFSGLGVRDRDSRALDGEAIFERKLPLSPTVEGVFISVPIVRPRTGVVSGAIRFGDKASLVEKFRSGSALEPGLLSEGSDGGLEDIEGRREPAREPRLLTGLGVILTGSVSKKFECDTLLRRAGDACKCANVSIVLSAKDGRVLEVLAWLASSPASSSTTGLFCTGELLDAPPVDILLKLGVRCRVKVPWYIYDVETCLLSAGSLEAGAWSRGESCSGRAAMGPRGSREKALFGACFGSFGWELEVGRYEAGRGRGRVFAAIGVALLGFGLVIGGGRLVKLPMPKLELGFNRSLEAEGRRRVVLASPPTVADKFSLEGDGRMAGDRGVGRRDIGRGSPLALPAACRLSSMAAGWIGPSPRPSRQMRVQSVVSVERRAKWEAGRDVGR